jgi:hypothetical protein
MYGTNVKTSLFNNCVRGTHAHAQCNNEVRGTHVCGTHDVWHP